MEEIVIFEPLYESANKGELILVNGGICHWHLRRDGDITLREIIVLPKKRNQGIGSKMLNILLRVKSVKNIIARCPRELKANEWYKKKKFILIGQQKTRTGKVVNVWQLKVGKRYEKA
jgi:hypothetical protein